MLELDVCKQASKGVISYQTCFWKSTEWVWALYFPTASSELLEGRLQLPRRVREGDPWASRLGPVGHHDPCHLVGERVQAIGCVRAMASAECGEQLVARGAARAGGEEAERDVE